MLDTMSQHQTNLASQVAQAASASPTTSSIHAEVDAAWQKHGQIAMSLHQGMKQVHGVAQAHAQAAQQLQEPRINAENEFNRILKILEQPMVSSVGPGPTAATITKMPQQRPMPYISTPPTSPSYPGSRGLLQLA